MLAMVSLFPDKQLGVELGSIILIFTGQVWNLAFSYYSSLKSIPRELREASSIYRFGKWQRFFQLELPYGAIGLIWNSIVSVAGGWFFLMACEMFVLGKRDFRLPGLGSWLQTAADNGDTSSMLWGLAAMIAVILLIDQLVWRPAIAWSSKFKFEQTESADVPTSPTLHHLAQFQCVARVVREKTVEPLSEKLEPLLRPPEAAPRSVRPCPGLVKAAGFAPGCGVRSPLRDSELCVVRGFAQQHRFRRDPRRTRRRWRDLPPRQRIPPHRLCVDHSRRRRHRL